jgi:hypothetical protein
MYTTIHGYIKYRDEETAQQVIEGAFQPWVESSTGGSVERRGSRIEIHGYFRNLTRHLIEPKGEASEYHIVETTTDGAFEGYVHKKESEDNPQVDELQLGSASDDSGDTDSLLEKFTTRVDSSVYTIDLQRWGEQQYGETPAIEDFDEFCEWQADVETAFFGAHSPTQSFPCSD